jgi:hypothetical protein
MSVQSWSKSFQIAKALVTIAASPVTIRHMQGHWARSFSSNTTQVGLQFGKNKPMAACMGLHWRQCLQCMAHGMAPGAWCMAHGV